MKQKYPLTDTEIRATGSASVILRADSSRRHDLDALDLMNNLCQWDDPPPSEARWEKKVAHACVIAVGFCKMANNYKEEIKRLEKKIKQLEK